MKKSELVAICIYGVFCYAMFTIFDEYLQDKKEREEKTTEQVLGQEPDLKPVESVE